MPTTPLLHRLALACFTALAAASLLAGVPAATAAQDAVPREFHLAGQTAGVSIWAERCSPTYGARGGAAFVRATPVAWAQPQPQPDPGALAAIERALRHGDFTTSGVRVVESDDGPVLALAGAHAGTRDDHFKLCNVHLRTSYD